MVSDVIEEPDQRATILWVGQDAAGHWLVQENHGLMEGRFVSRDAAWRFARAELRGYPNAELLDAGRSLVPNIPFSPVGDDEHAVCRAA